MTKQEINKELGDLIYRFKVLKKALTDEEVSPAHQRAAEIAASLKRFTEPTPATNLTREQILAKAKEMFEQQHAQRLANQLQKSGILTGKPPPRQPTSEEQAMWLASQGFDTEESLAKKEENWGKNPINNWLSEATKPLNQRFKSEDEERAYWDKIKVNGGNSGTEGY